VKSDHVENVSATSSRWPNYKPDKLHVTYT